MSFFWSFGDWDQQVLYFFIVDLHHWNIDLIFFIFIIVLRDSGENLFATDGNDTLHVSIITLLAPYPTIE